VKFPERTGLTITGTRYIIGWRETAPLSWQENILGSARFIGSGRLF
jgi:hypothetical protein